MINSFEPPVTNMESYTNSRNTYTVYSKFSRKTDDQSNKRHVEIYKHLFSLVSRNKPKDPQGVVTVAQIPIEVWIVNLALSNLKLCDVGTYILTSFIYKLLLD